MAWMSRRIWAGLSVRYRRVSAVLICFGMFVSARTRWYGVRAVSYFFDHFGAFAVFGEQFLLWGKEIELQAKQCVELVEQLEFGRGVVAVIPDRLAHHRPVLLLDVAAVVLVARP